MRAELRTLEQLSETLERTDRTLVAILAQRMWAARQVAEIKRQQGQPIYRSVVEDKRLKQAEEWATQMGINPHFARAMLYDAIGESCKEQTILLQSQESEPIELDDQSWWELLRHNLLALTEKVAPTYDNEYGKSLATQMYLHFEERTIKRIVETLPHRWVLLDAGCATGRAVRDIRGTFDQVVGYDISPTMIERATGKGWGNARFVEHDLEAGLPAKDNSVSLLLLNFGTASEIRNLAGTLQEIKRVLAHNGKAVLSFYNSEALVYRLGPAPYLPSLVAVWNEVRHCLDVHVEGEIFRVFARTYTFKEIQESLPLGLRFIETATYPTLGALLPDIAFSKEEVGVLETLDNSLAGESCGAYRLLVVGK